MNIYDDNIRSGFYLWDKEYEKNSVFALGEIPIDFKKIFVHIRNFYEKGLGEGKEMKILFNTISRRYPAWKNDEISFDIQKRLSEVFDSDLHLRALHSVKSRIVDELWKQFQLNEYYFKLSAQQLGFKTYGEDWYQLLEATSAEKFKSMLEPMMTESASSDPERK
ncbi:MAG: hypothetical protein Q7S61_05695 [bacterium]|nr:hypothetical protein [bacterium]